MSLPLAEPQHIPNTVSLNDDQMIQNPTYRFNED